LAAQAATTTPRGEGASGVVTLVDDDTMLVQYRPSRTGLTILSFAGVGGGGSDRPGREGQQVEFAGSLTRSGADDHGQIFVIDRRRTWLNGIADRLLPMLRELTADARSVVTIGNSMGGFSATWVAGQLPNCIRAIAMAPQASINPAWVPEEDRWPEYQSAIQEHRIGHAFDHPAPGVEYWAFFGGASEEDARHAALFRAHGGPGLRLVTIDNTGHDVVRLIKHAGALPSLIAMLLREGPVAPEEVEALLVEAGLRDDGALAASAREKRLSRRKARRVEQRKPGRAERRRAARAEPPAEPPSPAGAEPRAETPDAARARQRAEMREARRAERREARRAARKQR
jgi:pimeloyl-ACP methyl ester carboxylesterase